MEKNKLFQAAKSVFPRKIVFTAKEFKSNVSHNIKISHVVKQAKIEAAKKLSNELGVEITAKEFDTINDELRAYAEDNIYFK